LDLDASVLGPNLFAYRLETWFPHSLIVKRRVLYRRHKKEIATLKQELALKDALNGRPGISYDDLT